MKAFRARMIETIDFCINGETEEDVSNFLSTHTMEEVIERAAEKGIYIGKDSDEGIIYPIREDSICEIEVR